MLTNRKVITVFVLGLVAFMISSSAASANAATIQQLPTCTDPTGQNLPCMMVISTLPPPANALQCQETSGQILSCSYATQNLSNGEQIVAITVYVPGNNPSPPGSNNNGGGGSGSGSGGGGGGSGSGSGSGGGSGPSQPTTMS